MYRSRAFCLSRFLPLLLLSISVTAASVVAQSNPTRIAPERGFNPGGSYAASNVETIDQQSGNLMLNIPLGSLPAGRGGLSAGLSLRYNSKIWDVESNAAEAETGGGFSNLLVPSEQGGWGYNYKYELKDESDRECGYSPYQYKFSIVLPDGSSHLLVLPGSTDLYGYVSDAPDGYTNCHTTGRIARSDTLTFSTIDGTYLRLDVLGDGNANALDNKWILYLPDGTRIVHNPQPGSNILQRIYDRNNNYVDFIENANDPAYGGHKTTHIKDQLGRAVVIEYEAAPDQDWVRSGGFAGEELITKVLWKNIVVRKVYQYYFHSEFHGDNTRNSNAAFRVVDKVYLPVQVGGLHYEFDYNADATSDPSAGWGEVSEVRLPSGAKSNYSYLYDTVPDVSQTATAFKAMSNRPVRKILTHNQEFDGASTPTTEIWTYNTTFHSHYSWAVAEAAAVTTTSPAGSISTDYFDFRDGYSLASPPPAYAARRSLIKSVAADGTTTELVYRNNVPADPSTLSAANPYVKYEFVSIKDIAGNLVKTAAKDYSNDKNGNAVGVAEFDFVNYADVPRNAGRPTAPPNVAPKRVSVSAFYNPSPLAASSDYTDPDTYIVASSKRLRGLPHWREIRDANGLVFSRTEMFYDDVNEEGNLTESKFWDSSKGAHSDQLSTSNSVSIKHQHDQHGNRILTTDARGVQTHVTYGDIGTPGGSVTGLYPTEIKTAYNTAEQRTAQSLYDFHTGLVTRVTDVDNGVSTEIVFDASGRAVITKTAVGTPLEAWVRTEYDDAARRVVKRADLYARDDGKKVSIRYFDQLGRIRLSRTLEDAATEDALNEQHGIKVQTRYLTSGNHTYSLVSNPYRAATSAQATGEQGMMGWTRSKVDHTGRHSEAETFAGASPPAPWGENASSTGKVSTQVDADTKTVTDQAGRKRQGMTDALGRMVRVVEDPGGQSLVTTYTFDIQDNLRKTAQGEQPNQQIRYFAYDSLGRVIRARQPEQEVNASLPSFTDPVSGQSQWSSSYSYDDNGNTRSTTDARGITVTGNYDPLNRLTFRDYSDATPDVTFTYDDPGIPRSKGELTQVLTGDAFNPLSVTKYTAFDEMGRTRASEQTTGGQTFTFPDNSFYLSGALKSQTYPSGRVVEFDYNAKGDLAQASGKRDSADEARLYASEISYTAAGAIDKMRLGNGRWERTIYNSRLQATQIGLGTTAGDASLLKLEMGYGAIATENNGSLREQKISHAGLAQPLVQSHMYDSLNRLQATTETYNGGQQSWQQSYSYDRFGNRRFDMSQTSFPNLTQGAAKVFNPEIDGATNRLKEQQDGDGALDYDYDATGNLTRDAEGKLFAYDAEGRQRSFGTGGSESNGAQYYYDGQGKRVRKVVGSVVTLFIYDSFGQLAAEYENTTPQPNGTRFITADHLGSPRVVTDGAGAVVSRHDYMAFGEELYAGTGSRTLDDKYSASDGLRKQYTGYERDAESGLDFAQARYYNSRHGRFTSPDPLTASATIRDPQSFNRYSYALNSPYKFTDPLGLLSMYTTSANGRNWDSYGLGAGAFSSALTDFRPNELAEGYVEVGELEVDDGRVDQTQQPAAAVAQGTTCTSVNADMGESGQGFYRYGTDRLNYGQPGVVAQLTNLASDWYEDHPDGPAIGIGDLSGFGGAPDYRHHRGGHPDGITVDIRPMRNDNTQAGTNFNDKSYSFELTNKLVQRLRALPGVISVRFNDPNIEGTVRDRDKFNKRGERLPGVHDNHLHVRFRPGAGCQ